MVPLAEVRFELHIDHEPHFQVWRNRDPEWSARAKPQKQKSREQAVLPDGD
jgi:hypothetical protein